MTDLPLGWEWSTLGEVGEYLNGRGFKKTEWRESGRPIIRIQNLTGTSDSFNYFQADADDRHVVRDGDLLVSWAATLGVYVWRGPEAVLNQHIFKVRSRVDPGFHRHLLAHVLEDLQRQTHGSGIVHITKKRFDATPVPVPPLDEQERIVEAIEVQFDAIEHASRQLGHARTLITSLRKSAIAEMFDEADWEWTTLGEIAEVRGGVTKDSKRQDDPEFVKVPYLRVANVQRGYLDLDEVTTIRVPPEKASSLTLEENDILFNEGGDRDKLGRGWIWEGQIPGCIHQNHVFRARLRDVGFDPRFVSTHGNTWGQAWFERHGKQTTNLASINLTTLKQFPVPAPPLEEQRRLMDRLDELTTQLGSLEAEVGTAMRRGDSLRRSVLAAAFSGQLVSQDPTDEPARELLERIRAERPAQRRGPKKKVSS